VVKYLTKNIFYNKLQIDESQVFAGTVGVRISRLRIH